MASCLQVTSQPRSLTSECGSYLVGFVTDESHDHAVEVEEEHDQVKA